MKGKSGLSLTMWIIIATVVGIIFGSVVGPWATNLKFIGDIFINLIQMSVVVLVMTAVAGAIAGLGGNGSGKMGLVVFASIVVFTLLSAFLGVGLGLLVQPGLGIDIGTTASTAQIADTSITKTLVGFVPTNIFSSMASGAMVPCILFSIFFGACTGIYQRDHHTTIVTDFLTAVNGVILEIIKACLLYTSPSPRDTR